MSLYPPVEPMLAQAAESVPGPGVLAGGAAFEPKFDGHRTVIRRTADSVVLYARSGRVVTSVWMDLALAAQQELRPGTVLDGEVVIWRDRAVDFPAVQSRAASTPVRARELAAALPASYTAFDLIAHPELGDVRGRPYVERRRLMLELLEDVGPPIQPVPATDDRETALIWYEVLQDQGIEGLVAKRGTSRTVVGKARGPPTAQTSASVDARDRYFRQPRPAAYRWSRRLNTRPSIPTDDHSGHSAAVAASVVDGHSAN